MYVSYVYIYIYVYIYKRLKALQITQAHTPQSASKYIYSAKSIYKAHYYTCVLILVGMQRLFTTIYVSANFVFYV